MPTQAEIQALKQQSGWRQVTKDTVRGLPKATKDVLTGVGEGAVQTGRGMVAGAVQTVRHPVQTAKSLANAAAHPIQTAKAVEGAAGQEVKQYGAAISKGDGRAAGQSLGRIYTNVGTLLVPESRIAGAGRAGSVAKGVSAAAGDASRVASKTGRIDDVASSAKFTSQASLDAHVKKHGAEFGVSSAADYQNQASKFLSGQKSGNVMEKTRANGDIIRYNPSTNEFGVRNSKGDIKTYFKPKDGIKYYNAQK